MKTPPQLTQQDLARLEIEALVSRSSLLRAYHLNPKRRRVGFYTWLRIAKAAEKLGLPMPPEQAQAA
jgi:hypothetical protein